MGLFRKIRRSLGQASTWAGVATAAAGASIAANGLAGEKAAAGAEIAGQIAGQVAAAVTSGAPWWVGLGLAIFGAAGMMVDTGKDDQ